jgi:hypothetical protein
MDIWNILFFIFLIIIGLYVISIVIESSVKRGINSSVIGQYLEEKGFKENKKK